MNYNKQLDDILLYFSNPDFYKNGIGEETNIYKGVKAKFSKIDFSLLQNMIIKLSDDGYLSPTDNSPKKQEWWFKITFKGILFIENGGYVQQSVREEYDRKKDSSMAKNTLRLSVLVAAGTSIAALYYLWYIYHHLKYE